MSTNGPVPGPTNPYGPQPPVPGQPQMPPTAPASLQGYGLPQQGYGFPQQQMAPPQQGYAHPQQFPGAPAPATPPRKKKSGLIVLLVFALVLIAGAGGGAWYLLGRSSPEPLWSVPSNAGLSLNTQELDGTWFTDQAVIQTWTSGVKAYDRNTGKRLWATSLPGDGNVACMAPSESGGGIGIVAYGASDLNSGKNPGCDHVAAYDLASGKELWHKAIKMKKQEFSGNRGKEMSLARSGDVVVVTTNLEMKALRAVDGSEAWDPRQSVGNGCPAGTYTGGENLIRWRGCTAGGFQGGKERTEVSLIDPATGKAEWTQRGKHQGAMKVISSSPLVLSSDKKGMHSLDEKTGEERSTFSGEPAMNDQAFAPYEKGSPQRDAAAFGSVFVVGGSNYAAEEGLLTAYDLDSGKQLWKTEGVPRTRYAPLPGTGGDRVLAYVTSGKKAPKLVEFGAKDGAMTTVAEYPEAAANMSLYAWPYWHEDRVYVSCIGESVADESYALVALPTQGF